MSDCPAAPFSPSSLAGDAGAAEVVALPLPLQEQEAEGHKAVGATPETDAAPEAAKAAAVPHAHGELPVLRLYTDSLRPG